MSVAGALMINFASLRLVPSRAVAVLLALSLVCLGIGQSSSARLGATETAARESSGYGASGVLVVSLEAGGLAEFFDLREGDLLLQVNGSRVLQPAEVDQALRGKGEANVIVYARAGRKWTKSVTGEQQLRIAFLTTPEEADDPENPWKQIGQEAGLTFEVLGQAPKDFSKYAALVIVDPRPPRASLVNAIREFIAKGGGVVLEGYVPQILSDAVKKGNGLSPIAEWFGASELTSSYSSERGSLSLVANKPLGSSLRTGDQLFSYLGAIYYAAVPQGLCAETTGIVAKWSFALNHSGDSSSGVGAFYNRFGSGRVYWQFWSSPPNYPKCRELFIAGLRWAAGAVSKS
jgi:membrane-associated protease RseP (regulator of RpoE activity)